MCMVFMYSKENFWLKKKKVKVLLQVIKKEKKKRKKKKVNRKQREEWEKENSEWREIQSKGENLIYGTGSVNFWGMKYDNLDSAREFYMV